MGKFTNLFLILKKVNYASKSDSEKYLVPLKVFDQSDFLIFIFDTIIIFMVYGVTFQYMYKMRNY